MTESEEERKAAASRIVHNLKDGVDALTEVLENYENSGDPTVSSEVSINYEKEKTPLKSEISAYIVTESQIPSTFEEVTEKQNQESTSEDTVAMGESTYEDTVAMGESTYEDTVAMGESICEDTVAMAESICEDTVPIEKSICENTVAIDESTYRDTVTMEKPTCEDTVVIKESTYKDTVPMEGSTTSTMDYIDEGEVVWRSTVDKQRESNDDDETPVKKDQSLSVGDLSDSEKVPKAEELRVIIPESDYSEGEVDPTALNIQFNSQNEQQNKSEKMDKTSNHRRVVAQVPPQKPQPVRRRRLKVEDCVPAEYTSSPIVQILAKADQERPLPPRSFDEINKSLAAMSASSVFPQSKMTNGLGTNSPMTTSLFTGVSPGSSSGSSGVSSSSDFNRSGKVHEIKIQKEKRSSMSNLPRMGISSIPMTSNMGILEIVIRTHPIWYLPHLGRAATNHMLRPMPPGCFIVRASTRPGSMALSIKLPLGHSGDTDHYLIEKHGSTVNLEGSPHTFRSLPMLIEHYCRSHDELQCRLTLPPAIHMCTGVIDVQRIALMGQDFWTSELARASLYKRQVSQPVMLASGTSEETQRKNVKLVLPIYSSPLSDRLQTDAPGKKPDVKPRKQLQTMSSMLKKSRSETEGLQNQKDSTRNYALYGYIPPKDVPSSSTSGNPSTASSLRRSFAKLTSFKSKPKSKDDTSFNKMSAEAIKARQAAFRREKTDISGISVQRLAGHRNANQSPTAQMFGRKESEVRSPLIPPKEKIDENAMQKCIDELRNKRLNSSMMKTDSKPTSGEEIPQRDPASILKEFGGFIQNNGKPYEVILRNKKSSVQSRKNFQDRLSVPNLNEDPEDEQEMMEFRFGRAPDTGELEVINEGLITPVVRRKNFGQKLNLNPLTNGTKDNYTNSEYVERNLQNKKRLQQAPSIPQKPVTSSSFSKPAAPSRSLYSVITPGKQTNNTFLNWSEVNSELKLKQKVAKVRPTPQPLTASKMSSPGTEPLAKRQSEYAQLAESSSAYDPDASIGSFHSTNSTPGQCEDDDTVSVAGTVFNEPWDSSAWESLLEIAKYSDERPNIRAVANSFYLNSTNTIEEESSPPPLDIDDVVISCVESDSDDPLPSPESDDVQVVQEQVDDQMEESVDSLPSLKTAESKKNLFSIENNRVWAEMSQRIPSEPSSKASTFDPRKARSNSMMNVAANSLTRRRILSPQQHCSVSTSPTRLRSVSARPPIVDPGTRIQNYVETIAKDTNTVFGATLRRFIECTIEAEECDPHVVIRNVRQFLNGIKNYLVKHGEGELHAMIEVESGNLAANEFLNIDAILEAVLHKILLVPVKNHLYHLMVKEHSRNGSLQSLSGNLLKVRSMKPEELGFPPEVQMPDLKDMEAIKTYLKRMQSHYSPLKKLENLLKALAVVICQNNNFIDNNNSPKKNLLLQNGSLSGVLGSKKLPPADELIRWLVYILAKTSTINCEVEAWYMWELIPQQLLTTGDAAYYLTTLFSAVHVLKNPESIQRLKRGGMPLDYDFRRSEKVADAFVSVAIPDEQAGSIEYHTFPAVPQMNASKLCRVIAHQFAITNPEDYGLYILFDGFETCLLANECPDSIRDQLLQAGKPHLFAYKRHEAKIAWPKNVISSSSQSSSNPSPKSSPETQAAFQLRPAHAVQPSPIHKRRQFPVASKIV